MSHQNPNDVTRASILARLAIVGSPATTERVMVLLDAGKLFAARDAVDAAFPCRTVAA